MSKFKEYQDQLLSCRTNFAKTFPEQVTTEISDNLTWLSNNIMNQYAPESWDNINTHIQEVKRSIDSIKQDLDTRKTALEKNNNWITEVLQIEGIVNNYKTNPDYAIEANVLNQYENILNQLRVVEEANHIFCNITQEYNTDS